MRALLVLVLALGGTGCSSLPREGTVHTSSVADNAERDTLFDYTPPGPTRGMSPVSLVQGFLTAMTAVPLNTYVARQFLTAASGRGWVPARGTVVYGSEQILQRSGGRATLRLRDVTELDRRGTWLGDPTGGAGHDYSLGLVKQAGQWRISDPPDRLLIPRSNFESQYEQHQLFFLDTTSQVLVPEPVYVPRGPQTPTLLVSELLKGPEPSLSQTDRTFFPAGTSLDGISVPVTAKGTADVPLSDRVLDADNVQLRRLFSQLAWTLGQVSGVDRIRVSVNGTPVSLPGVGTSVGVDGFTEFDPSLSWASTALFGLRQGRLVALTGGPEERVSGPFGTRRVGLRSVAVDLLAQNVAAVSTDGRTVLEAPRDAPTGRRATAKDVQPLYSGGVDVLRPVYDLHGQLWLVDRRPDGARLLVVRADRARSVDAEGLTGRDVRHFSLSRDGTRLVAVVRQGGRDRVVVFRVRRDDRGRVLGLGPGVRLPLETSARTLRDVAWRSPSTVATLTGPSRSTSQVIVLPVDGSSGGADVGVDPELFGRRATALVSSSATNTPLFLDTADGQLFSLSSDRGWVASRVPRGLVSPTFVG